MTFSTELWSDGACSGNPGPGGWAYILIARSPDGSVAKKLEGHGGEDMTTNNRMELQATLEGLRVLARVDLLRMRTREGMAIARAKGRLKGKAPKLSPTQRGRRRDARTTTKAGLRGRGEAPVRRRRRTTAPTSPTRS